MRLVSKKYLGLFLVLALVSLTHPLTEISYAAEPTNLSATYGTQQEPFIGVLESYGGSSWLSISDFASNSSQQCVDFLANPCVDLYESIRTKKTQGVVNAQVFMPPCADSNLDFCIEGVKVAHSGGKEIAGQLHHLPVANATGADALRFLPSGSAPSTWAVKNEASGITTNYAVSAKFSLRLDLESQKFQIVTFEIEVTPVLLTSTSSSGWSLRSMGPSLFSDGRVANWAVPSDCAFMEPGLCGKIQDFTTESNVFVSFNSNLIMESTWFDGRIDNPIISKSTFGQQRSNYKISGKPMQVPQFGIYIDRNNPALQSNGLNIQFCDTCLMAVTSVRWEPWARGGIDPLRLIPTLAPLVKDVAFASRTRWRISGSWSSGSSCQALDQISGFVSTNAMAYRPNAPTFQDGQLVYEVAGTHYKPDGSTIEQGVYNLRISRKTADCLYGTSGAKVRASVSVTDSDGKGQTIVATVQDNGAWLNVRITGFHYSNPVIRVQLKKVSSKSTITCVKKTNLKISRKVVAVNPKCPVGYKQK